MDYKNSFSVSALGMSVERARVEVAALNLANANSAISPDGTGFRPMRVVAKSFQQVHPFAELISQGASEFLPSQQSFTIEPVSISPRQVYEPGHPMANSKGFVTYPAVDTATETVTMMSAMRAYEANVGVIEITKDMTQQTLRILA